MLNTTSLNRFLDAQDQNGMFRQALLELRNGQKTSHWIWFVFPQIVGLGKSELSVFFGIANLNEARLYLAHPVLGPRLHEAAQTLLQCSKTRVENILGPLDALKVRSCMTLFLAAAPDDPVFRAVLDRFYGGVPDEKTLKILRGQTDSF